MRIGIIAGAAALLLAATGVSGAEPAKPYDHKDLTGFWKLVDGPFQDAAGFEKMIRMNVPDAKPPFADPRTFQNNHPPIPLWLTPEFEAIHKRLQAEFEAGQPYRTGYMCRPSGLWAMMAWNGPIEIFKSGERILFLRELLANQYTVYFNRPHKADFLEDGLYGDNVGRWEGDTLVVDTINLGGSMVLHETEPHSQALHIVQRISRPSFDTLIDDMTADDPRAFAKPWKVHLRYQLSSGEFDEQQCGYDGGGKRMVHAPD